METQTGASDGQGFSKVAELRPDTLDHCLQVKVVEARPVHNRGGRSSGSARMSECTVGDESGVVVLTATGDQVAQAQVGRSLVLRGAKVDMYKGSLRIKVDKWGSVEAVDELGFQPKEDYNVSLVEYELVAIGAVSAGPPPAPAAPAEPEPAPAPVAAA